MYVRVLLGPFVKKESWKIFMYRFFVQPQVNRFKQSIVGYETLIRESRNGRWMLPKDFSAISLACQLKLLCRCVDALHLKSHYLGFNLNRLQLQDPDVVQQLIEFQAKIHPVRLVVELTEEVCEDANDPACVLKQIKTLHDGGVQVSLDDVGTGENQLDQIECLLPYVSELKVALQNFRHDGNEIMIPEELHEWRRVSNAYHLRFLVEGVETPGDQSALDDLDIALRQGYYYGKPHLLFYRGELNDSSRMEKNA